MAQEITVRRAKVSDADRMAAFVNRALGGRTVVEAGTIIERLGSVGFLLAERDGDLTGILGWQAENLVVRVSDLLIWPDSERVAVGRALLSAMEQAAVELQCEVVLLLCPRPGSPALIEFFKPLGYEPKVVVDLPQAWREAALEAGLGDDETVLMRQLRANRVVRPL